MVGAVSIGVCALMAWGGVRLESVRESPVLFWIYWGVFFVLFMVTLYIVLVDIRFIRVQQALALREAFRDTLGDKQFRSALRDALSESKQVEPPEHRRN